MCNTTNQTVVRNLQVLHIHSSITESDCARVGVGNMLLICMWHIPLPFATWCSPHAYDMNESLPHQTVVYNLQVLHMHSGITQSDCMSWTCMCLIPLRFSTWCVPPVWLLLLRHGINPDVQHYKSDRCPQLASPTYAFRYYAIGLRSMAMSQKHVMGPHVPYTTPIFHLVLATDVAPSTDTWY
jgi:hypothetical protein